MISKKYLLFLAGIVWSIAGYNVLHIGLQAYIAYLSPALFLIQWEQPLCLLWQRAAAF